MPNARAEVIANAGHLVFLDATQKFDELMLAFLGSRQRGAKIRATCIHSAFRSPWLG
ncbi:MAG: hypothetical protein P4M07_18610 [Xanthobacteraceae bacterium]|nr:hypothetical protein [Xanthobacteraceae bacterium]